MEKPIFVDNENMSLITNHKKDREFVQYDDFDDYNTPSTTAELTTFKIPNSINKKWMSTLRLRQKVKQNEIAPFYR